MNPFPYSVESDICIQYFYIREDTEQTTDNYRYYFITAVAHLLVIFLEPKRGNKPGCYDFVQWILSVYLSVCHSVVTDLSPQSLHPWKSLVERRERRQDSCVRLLSLALWTCFALKSTARDKMFHGLEIQTLEKLKPELRRSSVGRSRQPLEEHKSMWSRYLRFSFLYHCILFIHQIVLFRNEVSFDCRNVESYYALSGGRVSISVHR